MYDIEKRENLNDTHTHIYIAAPSSKFHFEDDAAEEQEEEEEDDEECEQDQQDDEFETAWDILDIARVIYEKSEDKETRLKLSDVHLCLGDVSVETGNNERGVGGVLISSTY